MTANLKCKNMENKHPQLNIQYQPLPINVKIWYGDMFDIQWICSSRVTKLRQLNSASDMYFSKLFSSNSEDLDLFAQVSLIRVGDKLCRTVAFKGWIWGTQSYTVYANVYTKNLSDMHKNQQCECVMHCTLLLSFLCATSKSMSIYHFRCGFCDIINHDILWCLLYCEEFDFIWFLKQQPSRF